MWPTMTDFSSNMLFLGLDVDEGRDSIINRLLSFIVGELSLQHRKPSQSTHGKQRPSHSSCENLFSFSTFLCDGTSVGIAKMEYAGKGALNGATLKDSLRSRLSWRRGNSCRGKWHGWVAMWCGERAGAYVAVDLARGRCTGGKCRGNVERE